MRINDIILESTPVSALSQMASSLGSIVSDKAAWRSKVSKISNKLKKEFVASLDRPPTGSVSGKELIDFMSQYDVTLDTVSPDAELDDKQVNRTILKAVAGSIKYNPKEKPAAKSEPYKPASPANTVSINDHQTMIKILTKNGYTVKKKTNKY